MVVAVAAIVTVSVPIPTMVVFEAAPVSLPVTREEMLAIVMRRYPYGAGYGGGSNTLRATGSVHQPDTSSPEPKHSLDPG